MKFRLVDQITSWRPFEHITGFKAVSFEEYSLKDAFGDHAHLPESLLLESILQMGNWLILLSTDFRQMGLVTRIDEVRYESALAPGEKLEIKVEMLRQREEGFELKGWGRVGSRTIISGFGCLAVPLPVHQLASPEDLRVLFSEIFHPSEIIS